MAASAAEYAVEDEMARYDNFDLETYTLKKERDVSAGLRGDTSYRAPISASWLTWRVQLPNLLAVGTVAALAAYEVLVLVSMFVVGVRRVMVDGGLMFALSGLNIFLCVLLAAVVLVTRNDWNLGMLTSKLGRGRPSSVEDDEEG